MKKAVPLYKVLSDETKNAKENCLMYNSIIDFIENDTTKIKKILEKYLFAGNTLRFEEDLMHVMIEFGRKIYQECLKEIEENIRQSEFRKKNYYVEHKADRRTLLTTFGNLEIERAYYKPKNGGKSVYLLDKYVGLAPHDKVSLAVKNTIHELEVELEEEIPVQKKKIKNLHIQADEDHVALQFSKKKGDLTVNEMGRKSNTAMPKLILLYEDIVRDGTLSLNTKWLQNKGK